jgi:hypothetical protein
MREFNAASTVDAAATLSAMRPNLGDWDPDI